MGGPMALNLMKAGYDVIGLDLDSERQSVVVDAGATGANDVADVVRSSDVVATSLPSSSSFVTVAEAEILPVIGAGQIVIDFGTVSPPETRRLAARFAEEGAVLLDVPVSGGSIGAQWATLLMFAGGDEATVERCRPILEAVGGSETLTYCGPSGAGQAVKGVNQLMMGLGNAAYLESIAFGVNEGVDASVIERAIGHQGRWRGDFNATAKLIVEGEGNSVEVKFRELPYFLHAAEMSGYELPLTRALRAFTEDGERVTVDDHREAPAFWHELTKSQ
jgi:3-hydroxyisobutyrate dehydrogenase-like beta-hydroxyacid dehydrogenase